MVETSLPIDEVLAEITASLKETPRLVLAAPPGAGKTTRVPLALMEEAWAKDGKILLLEPRRIAARMAAERMARSLRERVGQTVGLSTRIDRRVSKETRIEVITDGLFTRRLLNDPELSDVSVVLFDEFHERGLNLDLGLALARDVQEGLRPDLRLVVMSATLDTEGVAAKLNAPVIESAGRMFPVETVYLGKDKSPVEAQTATAIRRALREQAGSILTFLPGQKEIRRTAESLGDLGDGVLIAPLYGALSPRDQDLAVSPPPEGQRKVVLATDIAESSLTIEGVTVVVDAGLSRVSEFDPGTATQSLVTRRASLASVDQRRGRAGRTAPGVCYRLWDEPANRGLPASPTPEVLAGDLSGLLLSLAEWGVQDLNGLSWIDVPPTGRIKAAREYLESLGALNDEGGLTELGRRMATMPMAPHLAALIEAQTDPRAKALAAEIAVLLGEQGLGGRSVDVRDRISRFRQDKGARANALKRQSQRWGGDNSASAVEAGVVLASALPDRIARRRGAEPGQFLMAGGRAVRLDAHDPLATEEWLVIAEASGHAASARVTAAAPLTEEEALTYGRPVNEESAKFDPAKGTFKAIRRRRLGAITLSETPLPAPKGEMAVKAHLDAVREYGFCVLPARRVIEETKTRATIASQAIGIDIPLSDELLQARLEEWLPPLLGTPPRFDRITEGSLRHALFALLDWEASQSLQSHAPLSCNSPAGRDLPIDYLAEGRAAVEGRVQEFFGLTTHPTIGRGQVPLTISLTSPAGRPVAVTKDLPGFWRGGYQDMAKDMRGRYPKHDWPDDPSTAKAHEGRTKARLNR